MIGKTVMQRGRRRSVTQRRLSLFVCLVVSLLLLCPLPSTAAVVEGVVLSPGGPIEHATVYAYRTLQDSVHGAPLYRSVEGEKPGFFRLELPPGSYFLTASGTSGGAEFFAFHGANPVTIDEEKLWLPFTATRKMKESFKDADSPQLTGVVTYKGKPVAGAQVSLYAQSAGHLKGIGLRTVTTGDEGTFGFAPESGDYFVVARKRVNSRGMTPLKKGDLFCYYAGNPVSVETSKEVRIEVPCYPKDDLQAFVEEGVVVKKTRSDMARFREVRGENAENLVPIAGRVTDLAGNPKKGLYVTAYKADPSQVFQMHFIRVTSGFVARTDENGEYSLKVKGKGAYYLVAREFMGEAPLKGEYYGLYEGSAQHYRVVEENGARADIAVGKVMAEERRPAATGGVGDRENNVHARKTIRRMGDTVIDRDTVWEGEVVIEGVVVVRRGVTLTITPGTRIRFRKIDRNKDGIGDGEIRVLGRLVAQGTPRHMITFTSAEKKPREKDWSYLLFFTSGEESVVEYCLFEYAFTGLQAHFSKAVVRDSCFRRNHEGMRFGRAELRIEHNDIVDNTYGIRHHRLEGPVDIQYNTIRNNDVGIFLVPSGQNKVDFSPRRYEVDPEHRMLPLIRLNTIAGNRKYNYRLGERQGYDIVLADNWWGSANSDAIQDTIYDRRKDDSLGAVDFTPYLRAPVRGAGVRKRGMK